MNRAPVTQTEEEHRGRCGDPRDRGPRADPAAGPRPGPGPSRRRRARHGRDRRLRRAVGRRCGPAPGGPRAPRTSRWSTRSPGSVRCSSTSTTPRSRRSGSTRPTQVFVARRGEAELTTTILTDGQVRDLVEQMLKVVGTPARPVAARSWTPALPGGERLHVVIPDVTRRHWSVNIRKYVVRATTLDDLVGLGSLTPHAAAFLAGGRPCRAQRARLRRRRRRARPRCSTPWPGPSRRASGSSRARRSSSCGSSRGTGWRCSAASRAWRAPGRSRCAGWSRRRCACGPNRLLVGEVREAEALDLLIALNAGVPGMCTIHANSAREALTKLCTLPLLAGENVSDRFVVPTVASAVDLVVHLDLDAGGRRAGARDRRGARPRRAGDRGDRRRLPRPRRAPGPRPTATRRTPSGSPARGSTWPRCCAGRAADGGRRRAAARCRGRRASGGRSGPRRPERAATRATGWHARTQDAARPGRRRRR